MLIVLHESTPLTSNYQLVDNVLDYEEVEGTLGKPIRADLKLGLTMAPGSMCGRK